MSPEQFPPGPHNVVKFSTLNLLEPVPEHLQATFDVLHLRLLVLGLPKEPRPEGGVRSWREQQAG